MRVSEDQGWIARMWAFQALVKAGPASVPPLLERLNQGTVPERILAAQTLGYLGSAVPFDPLEQAVRREREPAVRLYLIDSLGLLGYANRVDWDSLMRTETNRDIRRHAMYAQQRGATPLDSGVVERLTNWDWKSINSAAVGQPAPDFELPVLDGRPIRLSDFRGRKHVILVFLYGDT
ncbi:MAG: hypothetical protein KatS3mg109_1753 [Pirellulaceae bacterium]|nr:MAG: hypothetical protein KatS3mg109_1753 [Pirellulaceae bacterium]